MRGFLLRALCGTALALLAGPALAAAASHDAASGTTLARAALLQRTELGNGWSVAAPAPARVPPLTCPAFKPSTVGVVQTGAAASPTFRASTSGPFVSQAAYAYETDAQETRVWRAVVRRRLLACAAATLLSGASDDVSFAVTGKRLLALPKMFARASGYAVTGTATSSEVPTDVYLDMVVLGRGRTITEITVSGLDQHAARHNAVHLARIVARRMATQ
jgi:hypothetical protein